MALQSKKKSRKRKECSSESSDLLPPSKMHRSHTSASMSAKDYLEAFKRSLESVESSVEMKEIYDDLRSLQSKVWSHVRALETKEKSKKQSDNNANREEFIRKWQENDAETLAFVNNHSIEDILEQTCICTRFRMHQSCGSIGTTLKVGKNQITLDLSGSSRPDTCYLSWTDEQTEKKTNDIIRFDASEDDKPSIDIGSLRNFAQECGFPNADSMDVKAFLKHLAEVSGNRFMEAVLVENRSMDIDYDETLEVIPSAFQYPPRSTGWNRKHEDE